MFFFSFRFFFLFSLILWGQGERHNRIFREKKLNPSDILPLAGLYVSLGVSVTKSFCNYSLSLIFLHRRHFFRGKKVVGYEISTKVHRLKGK